MVLNYDNESDLVKFCPICNKTKQNVHFLKTDAEKEYFKGYLFFLSPANDAKTCKFCKEGILEDSILSFKEFLILAKTANLNRQFLEAMIDLKKKDPIEYQLKFNQFKTQVEQQEAAEQTKKQAEEASKPHCPHCGSTNIAKIDGLERAGSIMMFGIFSKKINKSFKCKKCGYTW